MGRRVTPWAKLLAVAVIAFLAMWGNAVGAAPRFCNMNDVCEHQLDEYFYNCPDCTDHCGDGQCNGGEGETESTCAKDCGPRCGDGICDPQQGEYYWTCPADCNDPHYCGDGTCDEDEDEWNCAEDCGFSCYETLCFDDWDCWAAGCPFDHWCLAGFCAPYA